MIDLAMIDPFRKELSAANCKALAAAIGDHKFFAKVPETTAQIGSRIGHVSRGRCRETTRY